MSYASLADELARYLIAEGLGVPYADASGLPVILAEEPDGVPIPSVLRAADETATARTVAHLWWQTSLQPSTDGEGRHLTRPVMQIDVQSDARTNGVLSPVEAFALMESIERRLTGRRVLELDTMTVTFCRLLYGPLRAPWRGDEQSTGYGWRLNFALSLYRSEYGDVA